MLPSNRRIQRSLFNTILKEKSHFSSNNLLIFRFLEKNTIKESKFCVSVSKKVSKKAVLRNKIRRMGYNALLKYLKNIKTGIVGVFSFKMVPKDSEEVVNNFEQILKKTKIIQ